MWAEQPPIQAASRTSSRRLQSYADFTDFPELAVMKLLTVGQIKISTSANLE
jgi:hypothetical protein